MLFRIVCLSIVLIGSDAKSIMLAPSLKELTTSKPGDLKTTPELLDRKEKVIIRTKDASFSRENALKKKTVVLIEDELKESQAMSDKDEEDLRDIFLMPFDGSGAMMGEREETIFTNIEGAVANDTSSAFVKVKETGIIPQVGSGDSGDDAIGETKEIIIEAVTNSTVLISGKESETEASKIMPRTDSVTTETHENTTMASYKTASSISETAEPTISPETTIFLTAKTSTQFPSGEILENCLKNPCSDGGFINILISKKSNFTQICTGNSTVYKSSQWYETDGISHTLVKNGSMSPLSLSGEEAGTHHSGHYNCFEWTEEGICCYVDIFVTVYEVPSYKYHLIVICLITLACFILCLYLSVKQTKHFNTLTIKFVEKHGSFSQRLLT